MYLSDIRDARGLRQTDAAKAMKLSRYAYQKIEKCPREARASDLEKVAAYYGITVKTLLAMEEHRF